MNVHPTNTHSHDLDVVPVLLSDAGVHSSVEQVASPSLGEKGARQPGRDPYIPLRILFVCTANICRSPFMEFLARHLAGPDSLVEFSSAGTHGLADHPMDEEMATTLLLRDIVVPESFRSRRLTTELIGQADLVLTAETAHRSFILDDHPTSFRKVFTLGQFVGAARAIDPALHGRPLLEQIGQQRGAADPSLNVTDPYRQGPAAAVAAADVMERLLRVALAALTSVMLNHEEETDGDGDLRLRPAAHFNAGDRGSSRGTR